LSLIDQQASSVWTQLANLASEIQNRETSELEKSGTTNSVNSRILLVNNSVQKVTATGFKISLLLSLANPSSVCQGWQPHIKGKVLADELIIHQLAAAFS